MIENRWSRDACRRVVSLGVLTGLVVALLAGVGTSEASQQVRVTLRVHSPDGTQIVSALVHSSARSVKTSKRALCFGAGSGGSGERVPTGLRAPNALGVLADAATEIRALGPLRVTDSFADSFGLGLCGVGGFDADPESQYWAFWVDGVFGEGAVDLQPVRGASTIVFALRPAADYPAETIPSAASPSGRQIVVGAQGARPVRGTRAGDKLLVRDRARDSVRCGDGEDLVIADRRDRLAPDCEEVRRR